MKIEENNDIILGIKEFSILEKEEILGKLNTSINGLSYEKIINILGFRIDHSFLKYKKELKEYGYEVGKISIKEQTIIFNKR